MIQTELFCDCSKPAVARNGSGLICAQCLKLQSEHEARQKRMTGTRFKKGKGGICLIEWETYYGDLSPICGESLQILETMLKAA